GGGAKNPTLVRMLREKLEASLCAHRASAVENAELKPQRRDERREDPQGRSVPILTHEDFGLDSSAKEPLAFAILAHETLLGRSGNVPSVTGARRAVVLGKIIP